MTNTTNIIYFIFYSNIVHFSNISKNVSILNEYNYLFFIVIINISKLPTKPKNDIIFLL